MKQDKLGVITAGIIVGCGVALIVAVTVWIMLWLFGVM